MIAYSLGHALHQSAKLRQLIEVELRRSTPRALYLMRLKALLLRVQERMADGLGGGLSGPKAPALARVKVRVR